jgi:hypothetical protein
VDNDLLSVDILKVVLKNRNIVKDTIKEYHEKANWETFQLAMRLLNPQSYGAQFEKRIRIAYGWEKNFAKDRIGDASYFLGNNKINSEIKISLTTDTDKNVNILQIRESHKIDYYDIFIIHVDNEVERFRLSKEQMAEELLLTGLSLAHGTKGNEDYMYKDAEYRIDFKATSNDPIYTRWKEKYILIGGENILLSYSPLDNKDCN